MTATLHETVKRLRDAATLLEAYGLSEDRPRTLLMDASVRLNAAKSHVDAELTKEKSHAKSHR